MPGLQFGSPAAHAARLATACALLAPGALSAPQDAQGRTTALGRDQGCRRCHAGIEDMHPEAEQSCVDCHGGDPAAASKADAHVPRQRAPAGDERVAPPEEDLAWRRFANPMDLRVVQQTCGGCHEAYVRRVRASLHATTAGHLSDGYYEMGLHERKSSRYSIFIVP